MKEPVRVWAMPESEPIALQVQPRLESWDDRCLPSQRELDAYLDILHAALTPRLIGLGADLAIRLDVGLPGMADPLHERDLDNYVFPILARRCVVAERVVSAWSTKTRSVQSFVRPDALHEGVVSPDWNVIPCPTPKKPGSDNWKTDINMAVAGRYPRPLPVGPVGLQLIFVGVNPSRWHELWKPAIDALEPLLGRTYLNRPWCPQDGRIVRLGLHRVAEAFVGSGGVIVCARSAPLDWPELRWLAEMAQDERVAYFRDHAMRTVPRYYSGGTPVPGVRALTDLEEFAAACAAGQLIVRKGNGDGPKIHHHPDRCPAMQLRWFRPNRYFAVEGDELARHCWPTARPCARCRDEAVPLGS